LIEWLINFKFFALVLSSPGLNFTTEGKSSLDQRQS